MNYEETSRRIQTGIDELDTSKASRELIEDIIWGTFREALEIGSNLKTKSDVKIWLNKLGF